MAQVCSSAWRVASDSRANILLEFIWSCWHLRVRSGDVSEAVLTWLA
jgi:hypothetical protein